MTNLEIVFLSSALDPLFLSSTPSIDVESIPPKLADFSKDFSANSTLFTLTNI